MMTFPNADQAIANRRQAYNEIVVRGRRPVDTSFPIQRANIPTEFTAPAQTNRYTEIDFDLPTDFEPTIEVPEMGNGSPYMDIGTSSAPTSIESEGSYLYNLAKTESSNKWDAYNKGSKAYGKYQFIPSTEKHYMSKLGLTKKQARTKEGQTMLVKALTDDNMKALTRAGYPVTQENLYLLHQQGASGGINLLRGGKAKAINLKSNGVSDYSSWRNKFAPKFSSY